MKEKKVKWGHIIILVMVISILIVVGFLVFNYIKDQNRIYDEYTYEVNEEDKMIIFFGISEDKTRKKIGEYKCEGNCQDFSGFTLKNKYMSNKDHILMIKDNNNVFLYDFVANKKVSKDYSGLQNLSMEIEMDKHLTTASYFIGSDKSSNLLGIIDTKGNEIIPCKYQMFGYNTNANLPLLGYSIKEDYILFRQDNKYGVMELSTGKVLLENKYDRLQIVARDKYIVSENNLWRLINQQEESILEQEYQYLKFIKDDYYLAVLDNTVTIIDETGELKIENSIPVTNPNHVYGYDNTEVIDPFFYEHLDNEKEYYILISDEMGHMRPSTVDKVIESYTYSFENNTLIKN